MLGSDVTGIVLLSEKCLACLVILRKVSCSQPSRPTFVIVVPSPLGLVRRLFLGLTVPEPALAVL
jgi:hypothetical protein